MTMMVVTVILLMMVVLVVQMMSLHVMMALAYQVLGNAMYTGVTVLTVKMKLIVATLQMMVVEKIV